MGKSLNGKELGQGIVQKKDGRYEARYVDRFGKRKSISGHDLKDVKKRFNEAVYENNKEINIRENIKLDDWYEKWMSIYKFDTLRENSKVRYNAIYKKHISPFLGNFNIKDITQLQIRELLKRLKKDGFGYETRNQVRKLLFDVFNKAMIDEFVKKNPAKGIIIYRNEEKDIQVLNVEDQIDFFDCCKGTFYDNFFNVAINTGLRIGELAALTWDDIDLDNKVIHVRKTLVYQKYENDDCKTFHFEKPKTKTSYRDVPLNNQCIISLKKQYIQKQIIVSKAPMSKQSGNDFKDLLFTTKYNTPLNSELICEAIERIVKEVNLTRSVVDELEKFSCHCFRHTFATRCFEAGIQAKTVQTYLGHASLEMTMDLYTSVLGDHKQSEMNKLEKSMQMIGEIGEDIVQKRYNQTIDKSEENIIKFGDRMVV